MKKYIISISLNILFFFFHSICFSQDTKIDSLLSLLKSPTHDTSKVNHLNQLSNEYKKKGDDDNGLKYGNKALALASSLHIGNREGWYTGMAYAYNNIGIIYNSQGNYPAALKDHFLALKLFKNITDKFGIANTYTNIGNVYNQQANYLEALQNYNIALKTFEEIPDKKGIATSYNNIGRIYYFQGNYPNALKNYFAALKIMEEIKDKKGVSVSYGYIGSIYSSLSNFSESLKNYEASLEIKKTIGDKKGIAGTYNNIGIIYTKQGDHSKALKNHFASLKVREEIRDRQGISASYNNIGAIYNEQGNYEEALKYFFASLKIKEDIKDKQGIATSYMNLGVLYSKLNNFKAAYDYLTKALNLNDEIGNKEKIRDSYMSLAKLDSLQNNWKDAYLHHKLFIMYRDSIDNEETKKKNIQTTMTYEFEKKEAITKAEQDKKDIIATSNKKKQELILILISSILIIVFAFAGILFRSLHITRKQKVIIEEKNKLVEDKNKDIIDSINYAKRIQVALLKEEKHVSKHLPEHFILFKPKDIVSGDFYWSFEKTESSSPASRRRLDLQGMNINNADGKGLAVDANIEECAPSSKLFPATEGDNLEHATYWYLAAADCTGHGVPGAFMSMLGIAFLNEITAANHLLSPAEILDQLRNKIVKELGQSGKDGQSKDGMDISLMRLNLETKELQWAGANNPLWIIRKTKDNFPIDKKQLSSKSSLDTINNKPLPFEKNHKGLIMEYKPNKQPIGFHLDMQPFTNHIIQLEKDDTFYLFTDGYADQFGGLKEKKFMHNKLKDLLSSMEEETFDEYKKNLNITFENWKGNLEQVDDVTIIGIRI